MLTFTRVLRSLPFKGYFISSFAISLVLAGLIFVLKNLLPPVVPLFYGKPVSEAVLVPSLELMLAPGIATIFGTINAILAFFVSDDFLKKTLAIASLFISILSAITIVRIVFLVGFF